MPRFLSVLLGLALVLAALPVAASPTTPTVVVNGQVLQFDVPPVIENGRTLVPMRVIFEALGAEVYWDQETQTVGAYRGDIGLAIQIGYPYANLNGEAYELDVPAKLIDGRTMVPLRFISEALGAEVAWDQGTFTATITDATVVATQPGPSYEPEPPVQTDPTVEPEAPPTNAPLLGAWSSHYQTRLNLDASMDLSMAHNWDGKWYFFRDDGTYRYAIGSCGPVVCAIVIHDGKYRVEGGQLLLYEILEDMVPTIDDPGKREPYYDKAHEDMLYTFSFTDKGYLVLTDHEFGFSNTYYPGE